MASYQMTAHEELIRVISILTEEECEIVLNEIHDALRRNEDSRLGIVSVESEEAK